MHKLLTRFLDNSFWALTLKEVNQILRNKQLIFLLTFPPTVQLLIFSFALSPEVHFIKLGVVDYAHSQTSRELVTALTENRIFLVQDFVLSEQELGNQVRRGNVTVGLVIPPQFDRQLAAGRSAEVQVLIDGVDANTAGIASGYLSQIVGQFSQTSGAIAPIESMPVFFRYLSLLNPLRQYVVITRGFLLKGIGIAELWPHVLALAMFAIVLLSLSSLKFRQQLS